MRILGVSLSHDAGISVVEEGVLRLAVTEESFCRVKGFAGFPKQSLEWLQNEEGYNLKEFDGVSIGGLVHGSAPNIFSDPRGIELSFLTKQILKTAEFANLDRFIFGSSLNCRVYQHLLKSKVPSGQPIDFLFQWLNTNGFKGVVRKFEHHLCHQYSAVCTSGWSDCLAITLDGFGDVLSGRVSLYRNGVLKSLDVTPIFHSLGMYYVFATSLCGFPKIYHCGKVTGLAAYSNSDNPAYQYFKKAIIFDPKKGKIINKGHFLLRQFEEMKEALKDVSREQIASAVQEVTEEIVTSYITYWIERTGVSLVALAGGVFSNVKLNQRVAALPKVDELFVHPHMGDGGLATGAAYALTKEMAPQCLMTPRRLSNVFLGSEIDSSTVEKKCHRLGLKCIPQGNPNQRIAELLAEGKLVARVNGRMEYGPRALGNRSLLYKATDATVNQWLNQKLNRTEFMPFAPMVLEEDAPLLFSESFKKAQYSAQFMTITSDVTEECRRHSPAVVHVDGTARPQLVNADNNPDCFEILARYRTLTGLPVVINTSFNIHDEPIVRNEDDALQAFTQSKIDRLFLNHFEIYG